jgi:DNA repair exonuclease SbcCD ATPase subunit
MNASLQEHVGALKERCRHLEDAVADRKELQQNVQRLESDLLYSRLKQSEYHEQMEHVKSESLINESRLQTQVAKLEKELLEARGANETESSMSTNADEEKFRRALCASTMNSSLKEHITALMAKCSALEKSLADARRRMQSSTIQRFGDMGGRNNLNIELAELRDKNAALMEELHAARFDDIGERQKELHSEFNNLFNLVQGIANAGSGSDHAKTLVAMQMENDSLRKEAASIKARFAESQLQIEPILETELRRRWLITFVIQGRT